MITMTLTTLTLQGKGQEAMCLLPSGLPSQAGREGCVTMRAQASTPHLLTIRSPRQTQPQSESDASAMPCLDTVLFMSTKMMPC